MSRRILLAAGAAALAACAAAFTTPAQAADERLTLRIHDFEPIVSFSASSGQPYDNIVVDNSGIGLHLLKSAAFEERGLDLDLEVTWSEAIGETTLPAPDFLLSPRGAGRIIYESRPSPTKIALLVSSEVRNRLSEAVYSGRGANEKPACAGTKAEYALWAYLDQETLDSDTRVQQLLSAVGTLVAQANVSRDWHFPAIAGAWSWDGEDVFGWNRWLQQPEMFEFQNELRDYSVPVNVHRDFSGDYLPGWVAWQPWSTNQSSYGPFGRNDLITLPDVGQACDETWSFYPVLRPGWNLDLAETLKVRAGSELHWIAALSGLDWNGLDHRFSWEEQIQRAIDRGVFAAHGLVVEIETVTLASRFDFLDPRAGEGDDASGAGADLIIDDLHSFLPGLGRSACANGKDGADVIWLDLVLVPATLAATKQSHAICAVAAAAGDPRIETFFEALSSYASLFPFDVFSPHNPWHPHALILSDFLVEEGLVRWLQRNTSC